MKTGAIVGIVVAILTVAAVVVAVVCVLCCPRPGLKHAPVPQIIWTYWNSEDLPLLVRKCVDSWRRQHVNYDVRVLTPANLAQYMDIGPLAVEWNDSPAREADIVRLHVLAAHGGIWCDATVYLWAPFPVAAGRDADFSGYYLDKVRGADGRAHPAIESWCFATPPGGVFVTAWRDAFMTAGGPGSIDDRAQAIMDAGVRLGRVEPMRNYLFVYVAVQHVLQTQLPADWAGKNMYLLNAAQGPVKYAVDNDWEPVASVRALMRMPKRGIVKLWNKGRQQLEEFHPEWIAALE
jgi:hypothetical protein